MQTVEELEKEYQDLLKTNRRRRNWDLFSTWFLTVILVVYILSFFTATSGALNHVN